MFFTELICLIHHKGACNNQRSDSYLCSVCLTCAKMPPSIVLAEKILSKLALSHQMIHYLPKGLIGNFNFSSLCVIV